MLSFLKNKTLFSRLLISYLYIAILPPAVGGFLYSQIIDIVRKDVISANIAKLKQATEMIEITLMDLDTMATEININNYIQYLLMRKEPVTDDNIWDVINTHKHLPVLAVSSNLLDGYYIYFMNSDVIMSLKTTYLNPERSYSEFFQMGDLSYKHWHSQVLTARYYSGEILSPQLVTFENIEKERNIYVKSLYGFYTGKFLGQVLFLLDSEYISYMLSSNEANSEAYSYIVDEAGRMIASSSNGNKGVVPISGGWTHEYGYEVIRNEKKALVASYIRSDKYKWTYVSIVPFDSLLQKVAYIKNLILIYVLVVFLLGLLGSFWLSYRNSKPFLKMLSKLRAIIPATKSQIDEMFSINQAIDSLITRKTVLEESVQTQRQLLKNAFLGQLFHGDFKDEKEIKMHMKHIGLEIRGDTHVVILIRIGYEEETFLSQHRVMELGKQRAIMEETLKLVASSNVLCSTFMKNFVAILYSSEREKFDNYKEFISGLHQHFIEKLNSNTAYFVGKICNSLFYVQDSFLKAKQMMLFCLDHENRFFFDYNLLNNKIGKGPDSVVMEKSLLNAARSGDKEAILNILDDIYSESIGNGKLSILRVRLSLASITSILVNILDNSVGEQGEALKARNAVAIENLPDLPADQALLQAKRIYLNICDYINNSKKSHNSIMTKNIIEYLSKNYQDHTLCLSSISAQLKISEAYLSSFFKEQTGENISAYIKRLRITHANKLLMGSDKSINIISEEVGYTSTNTFRRAFKKVMGCSPSAYAKIFGSKNKDKLNDF